MAHRQYRHPPYPSSQQPHSLLPAAAGDARSSRTGRGGTGDVAGQPQEREAVAVVRAPGKAGLVPGGAVALARQGKSETEVCRWITCMFSPGAKVKATWL